MGLGAKILKFHENFFSVKYPLPKTDMAAIPDFSFGAMENWGLVTYQESYLLFADNVSDEFDRETITVVRIKETISLKFSIYIHFDKVDGT